VDGFTWTILSDTKICEDITTGQIYGDKSYTAKLEDACSGLSFLQCKCTQSSSDSCLYYELADDLKYNCSDVMGY
jgi:hypothetical protein